MSVILAFLASIAAAAGPLALAGGPLGVAVAWAGSKLGSQSARLFLIVIGALIVIVTIAAVTVHLHNIKRDADAFHVLSARDAALEESFGCPARAADERDLAACLKAIDAEKAKAQAAEIDRQRKLAAEEQATLDRAADAERQAQEAEAAAIAAGVAAGLDGPVGQVLLDAWARERKARGVK